MNASACWPYIRCSSRRARAACSWTSEQARRRSSRSRPETVTNPASRTSAWPAASSASRRTVASWAWRWRAVSAWPKRWRSSRSARSRVTAASTSRVERSGAIGSNVTATVRTDVRAPEQRVHEHRRDVDARPPADPERGVDGAVAAVVLPVLARAERPRVGLGETVAAGLGRLDGRELGAGVGIERRPQGPRELPGPERAEHGHLGGLEPLRDPLGLLDQRALPRLVPAVGDPAGVDLDRDQDLVLLGGPRGRADQLEVGLDHRRAPQRHGRIPLVVEPPGELVALGGGGPLDPLDPPDRAARGAGEDQAPARQPALLRLGVEQREREHATREDRGQPAPSLLGRVTPIGRSR